MTPPPPLLHRRMIAETPSTTAVPIVPGAADIAIVGAGVIGLAIGWRLAACGLKVVAFDAARAGAGTSAAATGMLAAAAELEPGGLALLDLARESLAAWPGFAAAIEAASGIGLDLRREGTMVVALGRDEVERLRFRHKLHIEAGLATAWLSAAEARAREPALRPTVSAGFFCPDDHQVDPPLVIAALRAAFARAGGAIVEDMAVERLATDGGRIAGVETAHGDCRAPLTILATGAASGTSCVLPKGLQVPVRPLKGQALALRPRRGGLPIRHVVWTAEVHLAPKGDGRLVVGATVEEAGFDAAVTAGGVFALLDGAMRVLPSVEEMAIEAIWTGFRPTSDDDAPLIGPTGIPGLALATGHHRNGYLLAPATARAFEDLVERGAIGGAAAAFGPDRFAAPVAAAAL